MAFIEYIRGHLIFDMLATLPQAASMLNQKYAFLKVIRLIHLAYLHKPIEFFFNIYFHNRNRQFLDALVSAFATFCWIMILLHYFGCVWIFVGSEYFVDFEAGSVPWTLDNKDFEGLS